MTQIKLREPRATDLPFIFSTFARSVKSESDLGRSTRTSVFYQKFQKIIDDILINSKLIIACSTDEENFIIGWIVFSPGRLFYTWVRPTLRGRGFGSVLVGLAESENPNNTIEFPFMTTIAKKIVREKRPDFIHNPFLLYRQGASNG